MRTILSICFLVASLVAAHAQSRGNPSHTWGGSYTNRDATERHLDATQAANERLMRQRQGGGSGGGGGTTIVNGDVYNNTTNNGPVSSSSSMQVHNLNEINTSITGDNNTVGNKVTQDAKGNQAGTATSSAASGGNSSVGFPFANNN